MLKLYSHFLEQVPVGDDLELLQDEEDPTADKEGLVFGQGLVQEQQIPFAETQSAHENPPAAMMSFPVTSFQSLAYLTPLVTSANCKRSYFLRSWCVGM